MEKSVFKTTINAPKEKVWNILWSKDTYPKWTAPFSEGSSAETDWQKGSKILFLDGKGSGMVSKVEDLKPNEYMSIKHLGIVKDGVENFDDPEVKNWAGAMENYTLRSVGGKTELTVDMDVNDQWKDYFQKTWPQALEKVKEIAEN